MNEQTDQWSIDEQIFYHHTHAYGVTKDLGIMSQEITDDLLKEHPVKRRRTPSDATETLPEASKQE